MPIVVLYFFLTRVLMTRNVMISPNAKCYSPIRNLMTGKLGQDCSYSLKNTCIWEGGGGGGKPSGSAEGLGWGKTSTFKDLHLTVAEVLWAPFVPATGSMSPNSVTTCTDFVMSWGFSGKQKITVLGGFELSSPERCWNIYWCTRTWFTSEDPEAGAM